MDHFSEAAELRLLDEVLEEAGGLLSWVKRLYAATDDRIPFELTGEIQRGVRDSAHRQKLLDEIDDFIREAEKAESGDSTGDFLRGGVIGVSRRGDARSSGKIARYIESLRAIRAKVQAVKTKDRT